MANRLRLSKFHVRGLVLVALAALATIYFHYSRKSEVAAIREARSAAVEMGPRIEVVTVADGPTERLLTLLADVRPLAVATLYSKVSGYLKSVSVDKGDRVDGEQILAEIESPELDQQYASAIADLENKRKNNARIKDLSTRGISTQVTSQQADTDAAIAEANVTGVASLKAYQYIRAPFNGRVAARFVDPGALITNAQTNFTSAQPLFTISDDSRLRIYVYVQQQDVPFVHVGDKAEVVDASNPDRHIVASVTRMTGELDAKMRTMLVEVNVDNTDSFLVPGSFAYVVLHIPVKTYPQVPVAGLIVRGADAVVATVENETVHFKTVKIASTDGSVASLSEGVKAGDRIAINLPDEVTNGSRVRVVSGAQTR